MLGTKIVCINFLGCFFMSKHFKTCPPEVEHESGFNSSLHHHGLQGRSDNFPGCKVLLLKSDVAPDSKKTPDILGFSKGDPRPHDCEFEPGCHTHCHCSGKICEESHEGYDENDQRILGENHHISFHNKPWIALKFGYGQAPLLSGVVIQEKARKPRLFQKHLCSPN